MNCSEIQNLLSAYLDRQLSPREAKAVDEHVAVCPSCCETLAGLRKLVDLLGDLPATGCPPAVASRLRQAATEAGAGAAVPSAREGSAVGTQVAQASYLPSDHTAGSTAETSTAPMAKSPRRPSDFFLRYKHFIQFAVAAAAVVLVALANFFMFKPAQKQTPMAETAFDRREHGRAASVEKAPVSPVDELAEDKSLPALEPRAGTVVAKGGYISDSASQPGAAGDSGTGVSPVNGHGQDAHATEIGASEKSLDAPQVAEHLRRQTAEADPAVAVPPEPDSHEGVSVVAGASHAPKGKGVPELAKKSRAGGAGKKAPVREITLTCASQADSRRKVDQIVQQTLGENLAGRLVTDSRAESLRGGLVGRGTGVPPVKNHGQDAHATGISDAKDKEEEQRKGDEEARRRSLETDKQKDVLVVLAELPWQKAPQASGVPTGEPFAKSENAGLRDKVEKLDREAESKAKSDTGAAAAAPAPEQEVLLLTLDLLESEANQIVEQLRKETTANPAFGICLEGVAGQELNLAEKQLKEAGDFFEEEKTPAAGAKDQTAEDSLGQVPPGARDDIGKAGGLEEAGPDAGLKAAGEDIERLQPGTATKLGDGQAQPPAPAESKDSTGAVRDAQEFGKGLSESQQHPHGQVEKPAAEESEEVLLQKRLQRRIRLVIRLVQRTQPPEEVK